MIDGIYWLGPIGWYHLVGFGVLVPLLAYRQRRRLAAAGRPTGSRIRHYRAGALTLVAFGGFSLWTAQRQGLALFAMPISRPWLSLGAAVGMYVAAVAFMRPRWRAAVQRRAPHLYYFMPGTAKERMAWVGVAVLAGLSEEITWRGVQPALVAYLAASSWVGVFAAALSFGAAHAVQGRRSAGTIVLFALAFQALVWLSGSLLPAMAVHAAYDITAGLAYGRLGRELGYDRPDDQARPRSQ